MRGKAKLIAFATGIFIAVAFCALPVAASAAPLVANKGINLQGSTLDFGQGGSRIYDDGNLHVATDDNMYLDAVNIMLGGAASYYRGSKIYDDYNLHIATDDNMYLDAPATLLVQNAMHVNGVLSTGGMDMYGGTIATRDGNNDITINAGTGTINFVAGTFTGLPATDGAVALVPTSNDYSTINPGSANVVGLTIQGSSSESSPNIFVLKNSSGTSELSVDSAGALAVNNSITMTGATRHTALTLANDGDLSVTGNTILGSSQWDNLTVNADANFNSALNINADESGVLTFGYGDGSSWEQGIGEGSLYFYNSDSETNVLSILPEGDVTITGEERHAVLTLANDGDLSVEGNTELGSSQWDSVDVYGTTTFYSNNGITMDASERHAVLDLSNDGDINVEGNSTLGSSQWDDLTVNASATFNSTLNINTSQTGVLTFGYGEGDTWEQGVGEGDFYLYNSSSDTNILTATEGGDVTITGEERHAVLTLANDGDLSVEGNTELGSSQWDSVDVYGQSQEL
ncbi:MAG: hypothetical protein NTW50_02690 [Candidatus Berkelbacteria bacterium]|nr:hypothetical protein [Candidatus Berkelbacteria bacterium]